MRFSKRTFTGEWLQNRKDYLRILSDIKNPTWIELEKETPTSVSTNNVINILENDLHKNKVSDLQFHFVYFQLIKIALTWILSLWFLSSDIVI
jgi:hypothetical protein